jgi:hypothetical protein
VATFGYSAFFLCVLRGSSVFVISENRKRGNMVVLPQFEPIGEQSAAGSWETVFVPKANLRPVPGSPPNQEFECSICKTRFSFKVEVADPKAGAILKAAIFKEWEAHLHVAHPFQWECEQKKKAKWKAKWEAASQAKGAVK